MEKLENPAVDRILVFGCVQNNTVLNDIALLQVVDNPANEPNSVFSFYKKDYFDYSLPKNVYLTTDDGIFCQRYNPQAEKFESCMWEIMDIAVFNEVYLVEYILKDYQANQNHYTTSFFFYEPYVSVERREQSGLFRVKACYLEKYFSNQKIYFCPKIVVVQSRISIHSSHKKFIAFFSKLAIEPFVLGLKTQKVQNIYNISDSTDIRSSIRIKDFFLSFAFSVSARETPLITTFKLDSLAFSAEVIDYRQGLISAEIA